MKHTSRRTEHYQQNIITPEEVLKIAIGMGVSLLLLVLIIGYPLYFQDGYTRIATVKFTFLKISLAVGDALLGGAAIIYAVSVRIRTGSEWRELSSTDGFLLFYLAINLISIWRSDLWSEGFWGSEGWYVGFGMQLLLIILYFLISRFLDEDLKIHEIITVVATIVFFWGLLNRFSIRPIPMKFSSPEFISSMGNINWLAGYYAVVFPIILGMYLHSQTRRSRILSGIASTITLAFGLVEGSDSCYVAMCAVLLFFLWMDRKEEEILLRWMELILMLCASAQVMRLIDLMFPEALNMKSAVTELLLGNLTLAAGLPVLIVWILWNGAKQPVQGMRKTSKPAKQVWKTPQISEKKRGQIADITAKGLCLLAGCAVVCYVALSVINTLQGGSLIPGSLFYFDGSWGSGRGNAWTIAGSMFLLMSPLQKLIGVGPDLFAAFLERQESLQALKEAAFGPARLTNAHNEFFTLLITTGILGMGAWIGALYGSISRCCKKAKTNPVCGIYAACIIGYVSNNFFSFQQIENLPYLFLLLGLAEYELRKRS